MSRTTPEFLASEFRRKLRRKLVRSADLDDVVDALMSEVPLSAYEAPSPGDHGIVMFGRDTDENACEAATCELVASHLSLKPGKPITFYLSTGGGSVTSGLTIISTIHAIRRAGRVVNTHIQGSAYSMGSLLVQAGTRRFIEPYGMMMLHDSHWESSYGRIDRHADTLEGYRKESDAINRIFVERTGKPLEYWDRMQSRREWWLNAEEALAEGLVDEILPLPV